MGIARSKVIVFKSSFSTRNSNSPNKYKKLKQTVLCFEPSPPIGAPDVGDMWGLYLFFSYVGTALWQTWGSRCRGYAGSVSVLFICWDGPSRPGTPDVGGFVRFVSVLFICWDGPLADLGLQMSGICGVCICCFYLLLEEEGERRRRGGGEEEKRRNPTTPT